MTSKQYYDELIARHKAYQWAAPLEYDQWVVLWWPTIEKQFKGNTHVES